MGVPAATLDLLVHSRGQSSILDDWRTSSPEPFISQDLFQAPSVPEKPFEGMLLEAVTKPLILMDDIFLTSLSEISYDGSSGISEDTIKWVTSEFNDLLTASHEASASAIRKRSLKSKTNESSWTPSSHNRSSQVMKTQEAASSLRESTQELRSRPTSSKNFYIQSESMGSLLIKVMTRASRGSSRITTAAITFTPAYEVCKQGVSVTLVRASDAVRSQCITRNITSFNVVPDDAPIFDAVECNDIGKVRELFSS